MSFLVDKIGFLVIAEYCTRVANCDEFFDLSMIAVVKISAVFDSFCQRRRHFQLKNFTKMDNQRFSWQKSNERKCPKKANQIKSSQMVVEFRFFYGSNLNVGADRIIEGSYLDHPLNQ